MGNVPDNIDPTEARDSGVIQEVNRRLLHPRGLALWVDPDTGAMGIYTDDDPGGWQFGGEHWESEGATKAERFDALICPAREPALGYIVQPLPTEEVDP